MAQQDWSRFLGSTVTASLDLGGGFDGGSGGIQRQRQRGADDPARRGRGRGPGRSVRGRHQAVGDRRAALSTGTDAAGVPTPATTELQRERDCCTRKTRNIVRCPKKGHLEGSHTVVREYLCYCADNPRNLFTWAPFF